MDSKLDIQLPTLAELKAMLKATHDYVKRMEEFKDNVTSVITLFRSQMRGKKRPRPDPGPEEEAEAGPKKRRLLPPPAPQTPPPQASPSNPPDTPKKVAKPLVIVTPPPSHQKGLPSPHYPQPNTSSESLSVPLPVARRKLKL